MEHDAKLELVPSIEQVTVEASGGKRKAVSGMREA
jgi:hypothetical protein